MDRSYSTRLKYQPKAEEDDDGTEYELNNRKSIYKYQKDAANDEQNEDENNDFYYDRRQPIYKRDERFKRLKGKRDWDELNTSKSVPPSDYTITHINQTHDFLVRNCCFCTELNYFII